MYPCVIDHHLRSTFATSSRRSVRMLIAAAAALFLALCSPADAAVGELVVTCTDAGTNVSSSTVPAAADGVHVRVVLAGSVAHDVQIDDLEGAVYLTTDVGAPYVVDIAPGRRTVTCFDPDVQQPGTPAFDARTVAVDVTDTAGRYVGRRPRCAGATMVTFVDPPAIIDRRRLRYALRAQTVGIRSWDVAEFAGYPAARNRWVRIRRGGRVIAAVQYSPDGYGRFVMGAVAECASVRAQITRFAGNSRGLSVLLGVGAVLDGTSARLAINPPRARAGLLGVLRARHAIVCRTPRGTLVGHTAMSSIDTEELTFLHKVDALRAARWRCEVRSHGQVVGRIGVSVAR